MVDDVSHAGMALGREIEMTHGGEGGEHWS